MSESYGLKDGDWYEASDGQWYCWPDPTPHASKPAPPPPAGFAVLPPVPVSVPATGGWDPPDVGFPRSPSSAEQAFAAQVYGTPPATAAPAAAPPTWAPAPQPGWGTPPPQPAWDAGPAAPPPASKRGRTLALSILGGVIVAILATTVLMSLNRANRDSSGNVTDTGHSGVLALRVGDCLPAVGSGEVQKVEVTPCSRRHAGEIFHVFELTGATFPGTQEVAAKAEAGCLAALPGFLGTPTADAGYELSTFSPVRTSWTLSGGKKVKCVLTVPRGGTMVGSAKGKGAYQP